MIFDYFWRFLVILIVFFRCLLIFGGFYKLGARGSAPAGAFFSPKKLLLYLLKAYFWYFRDFWWLFRDFCWILQARCSVQRPRRGFFFPSFLFCFFRKKSDFLFFWSQCWSKMTKYCIFYSKMTKYWRYLTKLVLRELRRFFN